MRSIAYQGVEEANLPEARDEAPRHPSAILVPRNTILGLSSRRHLCTKRSVIQMAYAHTITFVVPAKAQVE